MTAQQTGKILNKSKCFQNWDWERKKTEHFIQYLFSHFIVFDEIQMGCVYSIPKRKNRERKTKMAGEKERSTECYTWSYALSSCVIVATSFFSSAILCSVYLVLLHCTIAVRFFVSLNEKERIQFHSASCKSRLYCTS